MSTEPKILQFGIFGLQVCIPADWTDQQISDWTRKTYIKYMEAEFERACMSAEVGALLMEDIKTKYTFEVLQDGDERLREGSPYCIACEDIEGMNHRIVWL